MWDGTHLHLSRRFVLLQFLSIFFPARCFPPPAPPSLPWSLLVLSLLPISPSVACIFRSRVIKSAPERMCLNRISLIFPCPYCATQTRIFRNARMYIGANAFKQAKQNTNWYWFSLFPHPFLSIKHQQQNRIQC